jgi:hypothetical protein
MWVISKKAYRFTRQVFNKETGRVGNARIIDSLQETYVKNTSVTTNSISNDCCEVKPNPPGEGGKHIGSFGPPQQIPDWAKDDPYFKMCQETGDIVIIPDPTPQKLPSAPTPSEQAAAVATLEAGAKQESEALGGAQFDIANLPAEPAPKKGKKNQAA